MNVENLIPFTSEQSREKAKRNGKKGGLKSQEARRTRKTMQEQLKKILELDVRQAKTKSILQKLGLEDNEINNQMVLNVALYQKAAKGDTKAYEIIRDMIDGRPEIKIATENKESKVIVEVVNNQDLEKYLYEEEK